AAVGTMWPRAHGDGKKPAFAISSNRPKVGKTPLVQGISVLAFGGESAVITKTDDEAVKERKIATMLTKPNGIIFFDNDDDEPFGNDFFDALTTASSVMLNKKYAAEAEYSTKNHTIWLTGNNLTYAGDAALRILTI